MSGNIPGISSPFAKVVTTTCTLHVTVHKSSEMHGMFFTKCPAQGKKISLACKTNKKCGLKFKVLSCLFVTLFCQHDHSVHVCYILYLLIQ